MAGNKGRPSGATFLRENRAAFVLLAVSLLLFLTGILYGQAATVLRKAVLICLECIGIG